MTINVRVNRTAGIDDRSHRRRAAGPAAALICLTALGLATAAPAQTAMTSLYTQVREPAVPSEVRARDVPDGVFAQRGPRESRRLPRPPAQQYLASPAPRGLADGNCSAPYKIASGACVLSCPGGFDDRGSVCISRRD